MPFFQYGRQQAKDQNQALYKNHYQHPHKGLADQTLPKAKGFLLKKKPFLLGLGLCLPSPNVF